MWVAPVVCLLSLVVVRRSWAALVDTGCLPAGSSSRSSASALSLEIRFGYGRSAEWMSLGTLACALLGLPLPAIEHADGMALTCCFGWGGQASRVETALTLINYDALLLITLLMTTCHVWTLE
jgi:hypothetical protein